MNAIIANSYRSTLDPADSAYLYLDYAGEGTVTVMRDSDGAYQNPDSAIRWQLPATASLDQLRGMYADEVFRDCCYSLCNLKSDQDWRPINELFVLIIRKHLPGFDINQQSVLMYDYSPEPNMPAATA